MSHIVFTIFATPSQRSDIADDFRRLLAANAQELRATFTVNVDVHEDSSLVKVWQDYGFAERTEDTPKMAELLIDVLAHQGSLSGLSMRLSEVLTEREKPAAEALFQQVLDDPGTPRVPWHVEVRP